MYSWTGDKALQELEEANILKQCFPILLECATKVSHLFGILDYSHVCMLIDNLIICQGNQNCYRLGNGSTTLNWHVSVNIGRFSVMVFVNMYIIFFSFRIYPPQSICYHINLNSGLFSSLSYFFSKNGSQMLDYQLALQRSVRKQDGK